MKDFWNERYAVKDYVYGTSPNKYFEEKIKNLPIGKILLPAEGEGRNAVFASELGWEVKAFDQSEAAGKKATDLADKKDLNLNYIISDFEDFDDHLHHYDCVALIYAHFEESKRKRYHQKILKYLKPGGALILEGFSKNQINFRSGGPKNVDMLFSKEDLMSDFRTLRIFDIEEREILLNEGPFHSGTASVIRMTAVKPT
jgi:hypothetical protein